MHAVRLHETGGPQNLRLETIEDPKPAPGEILVRVRFAAFNHRDVYITQGLYPGIELPRTLGSDGCGEVAAIGDGVHGPAIGSRVVINPMLNWGNDLHVWGEQAAILGMPRDGTFAGYVTVPAANVFATPPSLSDSQAAAIPLAGLTAYRALITRGRLQKSDTVLISGIGGGVQTMILLLAKQIGARAVVTSSSDEKLVRAAALGADETLNYKTNPEWYKAAKQFGIDIAIDSAGGETLARILDLVKPGGRVVTYGGTTGNATVRPFSVFWKHIDILGTSMGSPADFAAMLECFAGGLQPVIDRIFPMEEAAAAAEHLNSAAQFGKVVLAISGA
ncbi:MAG: zinc-binding dehydrogenase [Vulcanimicrobiaceae bacterium]